MFSSNRVNLKKISSVIEGLEEIYEKKIKPVEQLYKFSSFHSPLMRPSDFSSNPMVLFIGQYSTGKTTFIEYILQKKYPGSNIGPEPTTDRFMAVMHGKENKITPGHALAVDSDKPFRGLEIFGGGFLNHFQCSQLEAPLLKSLTLIDTPGILSGEKQSIGRAYDYPKVCEWFAERSDMIILLFDAHKLDISDEFKEIILRLKNHEDKIRVILNKADAVNGQQLLRVYGALLWSLGKVIKSPEVVKVYIGSFWDQPYKNLDFENIFNAEQSDLLADLASIPKNAVIRKVNELVKRARLVKVHAYIISYLSSNMPMLWGKEKTQKKLLNDLENIFKKLQRKHNISSGDFPDHTRYQEILKEIDVSKLPELDKKLIEQMDDVLTKDLTELLKRFPEEKQTEIVIS
jgi:small GTP-binding protein